jgi:hypothetical protein
VIRGMIRDLRYLADVHGRWWTAWFLIRCLVSAFAQTARMMVTDPLAFAHPKIREMMTEKIH